MFSCTHPFYFRQHLNLPRLPDFRHVKNVSRKPYFSIVTVVKFIYPGQHWRSLNDWKFAGEFTGPFQGSFFVG